MRKLMNNKNEKNFLKFNLFTNSEAIISSHEQTGMLSQMDISICLKNMCIIMS